MLPTQTQQNVIAPEKIKLLLNIIASAKRMRFAAITLHIEYGQLRRIEGPAPIIKLK